MAKNKSFQPMLSGKAPEFKHIRFPVLASEKLDGVRCIMRNGIAYSRTLKPIPNLYVQHCLKNLPNGIDGELICGDIHDPNVFGNSQSGVMSFDGTPDFKFYVFDKVGEDVFYIRLSNAVNSIRDNDKCIPLSHYPINTKEDLQNAVDYYVGLGGEGVMIRDPHGPYKFGRSTEREGYLLKIKPFKDTEAVIIGFEELMTNNNEAELSETGLMKRGSSMENKVPANKLGAFVCRFHNMPGNKEVFNIGSGLNDKQRIEIWQNKENYLGKVFNFKYQGLTPDAKPRIPIFKGFRSD